MTQDTNEYSKRDPSGTPKAVTDYMYKKLFGGGNALGHGEMGNSGDDSHSDSGAGDGDRIRHVVDTMNKLFAEEES